MKAQVKAAIAGLSDAQKQDHDAIWGAICNAIVTYIQTNAVITTTVTGVATGAMAGGPGVPVVGSATGTIA